MTEQIQLAYAHRYILLMVIYRFMAAMFTYGAFLVLTLLGMLFGIFIAVLTVLVFYSALDFIAQFLFPAGLLR